jgi:hypothetical protein
MVAALAGWMAARLPSQRSGAEPPVRANVETRDTVQIDRELVAVYDAVARLPGGERVRFRCREWRDQIVVSDPLRGMVIEQSTPTLDVVPIRFETY